VMVSDMLSPLDDRGLPSAASVPVCPTGTDVRTA